MQAIDSAAKGRGVSDQEAFLDLSEELTGFDVFDLVATGQARAYFEMVTKSIGADTLQRLFGAWREIADMPATERARAITDRIMDIPALGDAAQRIIALWYVGSWYSVLPGGSHALSSDAYVEGLMWKAIGAHPMGAKPQGYGAWAAPPPSAPSGRA